MDYFTIDFETANSLPTSACSIGIVGVKNKKAIIKKHYLINPEQEFADFATSIHNIKTEDVKDAPNFKTLWEDIKQYFDNTIVFSHNSGFDFNVLKSLLEKYNIEKPEFRFGCTVKIARGLWSDGEVQNHKLNTIAGFLEYPFTHHNALSDASVCAKIINTGLRMQQVYDVETLYERLNLRFGFFGPNNYYNSFKLQNKYKVKRKFDNDKIANKLIVVSGNPDHIKRKELIRKLIENGGFIETKVSNKCDYFVKLNNCDNNKLNEVNNLIKKGVEIKVFNEKSILALVK